MKSYIATPTKPHMNPKWKFTLMAGSISAALLASLAPAQADIYALVLSEKLPDFETLAQQLGPVLKNKTGPDDGLIVYDGFARKLIADIGFPSESRFRHFPIRRRFARQQLKKIAEYLDEHSGRSARETSESEVDQSVTLRTQFFNEFADNVVTLHPGQRFHVLLSGRSLEHDPRQPSFSMGAQQYPNDAHFRVSSFVSRFGASDRQTAQDGVNYHFCATDQGFESTLHQKTVARVWAVFLKTQKGNLASFTDDEEVCFQRFMRASHTVYDTALNPAHTQLEMLTLGTKQDVVLAPLPPVPPIPPVQTPVAVLQANSGDDFITAPVAINRKAALNTVAIAKVGISWSRDCHPCDLDLHVTPKPGAKTLYYSRKSTAEGNFHKDWTSSPNTALAFEYVDITEQLDVRNYKIAINFYSGSHAAGPKGVIRIWLEGERGVFEKPFHIPASKGNRGRKSPNAAQWIIIDPSEILGLTAANNLPQDRASR